MEGKDQQTDKNFFTKLTIAVTTDNNPRSNIATGLKMIGNYCDCDRIHVIKTGYGLSISISHEWCNRGIEPVREYIQGKKHLSHTDLQEQLNLNDHIRVNHRDELRCEELKKWMQTCEVHRLVVFPLYNRFSFSLLCLSRHEQKKEWEEREMDLFFDFSAILAANLEKNTVLTGAMNRIRNNTTVRIP
ncbi:MAG: hypothetical protein LBR65_06145 [Culturomica sp.]|jgi:hypothetical protein|nr:hypothetical protein [Culturomica sp.]